MALKPIPQYNQTGNGPQKRLRIRAIPGNKNENYITIKLETAFDYLDVLSLSLSQLDTYRLFRSDFGVIAGRVIGQEGVGIPNCRIGIFVPRKEDTFFDGIGELRQLLVKHNYPFDSVTDENSEGKRFNLLPANSRNRGYNGFQENPLGIGATPKTPIGDFFEKEEVITNQTSLSVFDAYYKYTTVTNESGDFMLYGVPVGGHILHMDCDMTDIGPWSTTPMLMSQTLGYNEDMFDNGGTKIRESSDLSSMPHLISQNISVSVKPLWSQREDEKDVIGVTRQDFKITAPLKPHFTIFGSNFTMGKSNWWGDNVIFRLHYGWKNLCIQFGPKKRPPLCDPSPRFFVAFDVRIGFQTTFLGKKFKLGDPDGNGITFRLQPTFDLQIPNLLPFFRIEVSDNYCRLDGGKYDNSPFDIINHGKTCQCDTSEALQEIPDSGITDALSLRAHRSGKLGIRIFGISDNLTDGQANQVQQVINTNRPNRRPVNSQIINALNEDNDIEMLPASSYAKIIDDGQFVMQVYTNRRRMVTAEDGQLVDSEDPKVGVFTEFRGYAYVQSDEEIDNPRTKDRTARIALKIPQSFDYSIKPKEWLFDHGVFRAGEYYSVAQKIATKYFSMSPGDEEENDLNGVRRTDDPNDTTGKINGAVGWDNQSGLILDVDDLLNQNRTVGITTMPATHITHVGNEYSYELPGTLGGDGGIIVDPDQGQDGGSGQNTFEGPGEVEGYDEELPNGYMSSAGMSLMVRYKNDGTPFHEREAVIIVGGVFNDIGSFAVKIEVLGIDVKKKFVIDNGVPSDYNPDHEVEEITYIWDGVLPNEFLPDPENVPIPGRLSSIIRIRVSRSEDPTSFAITKEIDVTIPRQ